MANIVNKSICTYNSTINFSLYLVIKRGSEIIYSESWGFKLKII